MLTIAVCDDESSQRDLICQMLRSDLERRPSLAAKIRTFSSGQELLSAVEARGLAMPPVYGLKMDDRDKTNQQILDEFDAFIRERLS